MLGPVRYENAHKDNGLFYAVIIFLIVIVIVIFIAVVAVIVVY